MFQAREPLEHRQGLKAERRVGSARKVEMERGAVDGISGSEQALTVM